MKKIKIISIGILSLSMFSIAGLALATATIDPIAIAGNIFRIIVGIFIAIAGIGFLISGLLFITSGGSEDKIKKAKTIFIYSIIGIIVGLIGGQAINWVRDYIIGTGGGSPPPSNGGPI